MVVGTHRLKPESTYAIGHVLDVLDIANWHLNFGVLAISEVLTSFVELLNKLSVDGSLVPSEQGSAFLICYLVKFFVF